MGRLGIFLPGLVRVEFEIDGDGESRIMVDIETESHLQCRLRSRVALGWYEER